MEPILHSVSWESYRTASVPTLDGENIHCNILVFISLPIRPLLQHLKSPDNFARLLFINFSSAFNTIQSHKTIRNVTSHSLANTGVPQGCILSPYTLIIKECKYTYVWQRYWSMEYLKNVVIEQGLI